MRAIRLWPVAAARGARRLRRQAGSRDRGHRRGAGRKDRQRPQLVRLHRRHDGRGLREGDRDQGHLRRVRLERGAGDQAALGPLGLRRGRADRAFPRAPDQGGRVPAARQVEAAEPQEHGPGAHAARRRARPGQPVFADLPLGHDRPRLQPGHGQEGARHRHRRQLGDPAGPREREEARQVRHRDPRRARPTCSAPWRSTWASTRTARSPRTSRLSRTR